MAVERSTSHPDGTMADMDLDERLCELAEQQHGFVRVDQARALGLTWEAQRHRVDRGDWEQVGPRLLRRTGAPWSRACPLVRAVLDAGPGAVLSHTTAAAWWGMGFDLRPIHVTRPRGATSAPARFADRLHQVLDLTGDQVTVLDGVPIARPERVALELFGLVHPDRAARAVEVGWSRRLYDGSVLRQIHEQLADRGRKGTVAMREFLEQRPPGWVPPASALEARVAQILRDACLGRWRRQVDLGGDRWCGRVDLLHESLPLVVEVQSERYHAALLDREHDARRAAALRAAGFTVVEVWDTEVWHHPDVVEARVEAAVRELRARQHQLASANLHRHLAP